MKGNSSFNISFKIKDDWVIIIFDMISYNVFEEELENILKNLI
jgi:hypothetical protein